MKTQIEMQTELSKLFGVSPETKLREHLALVNPQECERHPTKPMLQACALQRAYKGMGIKTGNLLTVAKELGFSMSQAYGIMDGWDSGIPNTRSFAHKDRCNSPCEYREGYALGAKLFKEFA